MNSKHPDRTSEWSKQQQILKNYRLKKLAASTSDDTDKKPH